MPSRKFVVSEDLVGLRLDVFLTQVLADDIPSRMFVKRLIEALRVTVNGKQVKVNYKLSQGDAVEVLIEKEDYPDEIVRPEDIALDIVYEDEAIIAINKPIGMTVHPAAGNHGGTLVNALLHYGASLSDVNGDKRPGIVHRLDRETSGIILVAKTNQVHEDLARQFERQKIEKKYIALVQGNIQFNEGVVDAPIDRHGKYHDMRRVGKNGQGKPAFTYYKVIERREKCTLVALYPKTGRTHQLRLHMRYIGHAILGDEKYGHKESFSRMALHAQWISFHHPLTDELMKISVPVPKEFE